VLKIKVHDPDCTPSAAYDNAAAIDLRIGQDVFIQPGEIMKVGLGVSLQFEDNTAGLVLPRSSCKGFVLTNAVGLIDPDYRGELFVKIKSVNNEPMFFPKGERLVQLMVVPFVSGFTIVDKIDASTARGDNGDGSSGK
jgi:dUTP pyrophosphatase